MRFESAAKTGDYLTLKFIIWPEKNAAKVKQTELVFQFKNVVSESHATNELFSMMSRYVQRREELQNINAIR